MSVSSFIKRSKKFSIISTMAILFFIAILSSSCDCTGTVSSLILEFYFPDGVEEHQAPSESKFYDYNRYRDDPKTIVRDITPPNTIYTQVFLNGTRRGEGTLRVVYIMFCGELLPDQRPPKIRAMYDSGIVTKPGLGCQGNQQTVNINMYEIINQGCD